MKAKELAEELLKNPELEVMILDGFNGGGYLRTINLGPGPRTITKKDADECGDCEGRKGERIIQIGYGCY